MTKAAGISIPKKSRLRRCQYFLLLLLLICFLIIFRLRHFRKSKILLFQLMSLTLFIQIVLLTEEEEVKREEDEDRRWDKKMRVCSPPASDSDLGLVLMSTCDRFI